MRIEAFTWGYYGWGQETEALVRLANAVEAGRGKGRPVFVDVRVRRQGRARGFVGDAFERVAAGSLWMPGLGNRRIVEGREGIEIVAPETAARLLDVMRAAAESEQRVIFFCGCASPERRHLCHRAEVARLVMAEAKRRRVALAIDEWPGGPVVRFEREVEKKVIGRVRRVDATDGEPAPLVTLAMGDDEAVAMQIGHGSIGVLRAGEETAVVVTGPVVKRARGWCLPIHAVHGDERAARAWSAAWRVRLGLAAGGPPAPPPEPPGGGGGMGSATVGM